MAATHEDRNAQLSPGVAIKAPCKAATIGAITLSGEQTVDGVALVSGDRCLVKNQVDQTANGIYGVSTGSWAREPDFDGTRDVVTGTFVFITNGATNAGAFYECTTTGTIVFGTSNITFAVGALGPIAVPVSIAQGGTNSATAAAARTALGTDLATNVNFTSAGAGAVVRTVQSKERDFVSVKDFGAIGDGVTNDTAALQAAIAAAAAITPIAGVGGTTVCVPEGVYLTTTTLVIPNAVRFVGAGYVSTEIKVHGSWSNPTPNVIVRLGVAGSGAVFGARVENMSVNALGTANVICVYGEALQTDAGCKNVLARAFGAAGFQTRVGTGSPPLTNNDYSLVDCGANNGISATGIGFDLDAGAGGTFSPTLVGLSHSNAAFPAGLCPVGLSLKNGPFHAYRLTTEYATDGVLVDDTASAAIFGIHGNFCTNVVTKTSAKIVVVGASRSGTGTNLIKDNSGPDNNVTATVCGLYVGDSDLGGEARGGVVFSRAITSIQRTNAALALGSNNDYSVFSRGSVRLTTNAGGSAITGIAAGAAGQRLRLFKVGGAGALTITNSDAASAAANRILTPTAGTITVTFSAELEYDGTSTMWRVASFV